MADLSKEVVEEGQSKDVKQIQSMSEVPPKKLKQTELLSFFQESPKKQTATDSEPGEKSEASDNVQTKMDYLIKKEVEEGPSKHLKQETEAKKHNFKFSLNSKTFSVACKTFMTVLEALNTSPIFRSEKDKNKNMQKEILIQRSKGAVPRAAVKTDFPCCLIERDEILDIDFIQKDENSSTNQTTVDPSLLGKRSKPETLVTIWVKKEGGPKVQCLLKSKALRKSVRYVCVFGFKGEKVKTALKRDGRFNNVIFKKHCGLSELGGDTNHELSIPVEDLEGKSFQVVVLSDQNQPDSQDDLTFVKTEANVASDADVAETAGSSQNPINTERDKKQDGNAKSMNPSTKGYDTKPIVNSEEILGILRDQFKDLLDTLKQREKLKNKSEVQRFFREEYGRSVENFLEVKKVKQLMKLSDSVCQIRKGGSPEGTGFLLFDRFILTNAHVIGIFTDLTKVNFAEFTAVFDYEDMESEKRIQIKQLTDYCYRKDEHGRHLDYALLELDDNNDISKYHQLLYSYSPNLPNNRCQICIVGHPGVGVKKMDPCIIIGTESRLDAEEKHKTENVNVINVMTRKSLEEKWDFHKNQITYNSCFFHGSSGSPVFDADCNLIGIHTGGYVYEGHGKTTKSVMEYAYSIQPILNMIKAQTKIKGLLEIVKILEPYCDQSNVSETPKATELD
ncbi:protein FAM111A [Sinocyclocheilus anshuiensis]|uniref:Protein FAM111A-like n=1 Tax=Sinocyclocheilus anshuiensis TaxID=1608454 RepID=A0A671QQ05_9TELE|nr:PREDICTED: protein FAM111A-like [Sinocyclocheilus anshuiensis]XP_016302269.1 PREDICTED: protein FAM111A-like [Sinocyclocheilus anshuiensis]